jgi:multidrug efflux pump subunit AcrA (membrane-fusion protein)
MAIHSAPAPSTDDARHEVDQSVDEMAQWAKSDLSPGKFYRQVLERVVTALGAEGGTIWTRGHSGEACRKCQVHPPHPWLVGAASVDDSQPRHADLIAAVLKSGSSRLIGPQWQPARGEGTSNPTDFLLIVIPWTVDGAPRGAIEVFQKAGASPQMQQACVAFLEAIAELAADYCRNRLLRDYRRRAGDEAHLAQFARAAHASLDLQATAYTIANDGRALLRCDRLTVLVRGLRGQYRVAAVSGVESVRRRVNLVRRLEQLATAVAKVGETLWYPASRDDLLPQVAQPLSAYLDESHSRWLAVLPLETSEPVAGAAADSAEDGRAAKSEIVGILVAEQFRACTARAAQFKGKLRQRRRSLLLAVCEHSALALRNASEFEAIPFAGLLRKVGQFRTASRMTQVATVLAVMTAVCLALCWIPADFYIEAQGELQPRHMADVFAATDGVVSSLHAEHGQHVRARQVLAELRRPQLDLVFKQVWGELQTARQRLASSEAAILELPSDTGEQRRRHSQLIAEKEELQEVVRNREEQLSILKQQQAELQVTSPMDGEVLTWDVAQLLQDRPVDRGQALLTVGDLAGPWKLELRIPDREVAHVLNAERAADQPLDVTYCMITRPGVTLKGTVERVSRRSETAGNDNPYVLATVAIDRDAVPELIPGATAKAWIHCGRQAVGYVWFHDLLDTLRVWFYW